MTEKHSFSEDHVTFGCNDKYTKDQMIFNEFSYLRGLEIHEY